MQALFSTYPYPFSWCHVCPFTSLWLPPGRGSTVDHQHLESCACRSMMLGFMISSSFSPFFLEIALTWGFFCTFSNKVLLFAFSSLACNYVFFFLFILSVLLFVYLIYSFFLLFFIPKNSFVQLQVCISLTDHWQVIALGVSSASLCPISYFTLQCLYFTLQVSVFTSQGCYCFNTPVFLYPVTLC